MTSTYQETSREAYERAPNRRQQMADAIALRSQPTNDPYGATDWELHEMLGCPYTSVQGTRGLLVKVGLVRDSGQRRETPYGRPAIVWETV